MFTQGRNRQRLQRWCTGAGGEEDDAAESDKREKREDSRIWVGGPVHSGPTKSVTGWSESLPGTVTMTGTCRHARTPDLHSPGRGFGSDFGPRSGTGTSGADSIATV